MSTVVIHRRGNNDCEHPLFWVRPGAVNMLRNMIGLPEPNGKKSKRKAKPKYT